MTHNEHIQQLQKQLKHAGGFETSLIEAWFKADGDNQRRIEEAFPHDYRIPIGKPPIELSENTVIIHIENTEQ